MERGGEGKGREQVTTVQVTTVGSGESALDSQPWDPSAGKESACNAGELGSVPGLGRSPGEGEGSPFQYSGLENSMDCIVHGIAKSRLSDFHKTFNRTKADLRNTGRNFAKR